MLAVKVALRFGEKARKLLAEQGVLAKGFEPRRVGKSLLVPVVSKNFGLPFSFKKTTASFKPAARPVSFKEALAKKGFSEAELEKIVRAFDSVGDIALIEVPEELEKKKRAIARALMESNPGIKVVAKKIGALKGKYRTRELEIIGGEKRTETVYRESGCVFKLDVSRVYFSPRLSFERQRIAELVKPVEKVLVLFAGVGPYPVIIAKKQPKARVVAVELNPVAVKYLKENIAANKVMVEVAEGDVRKIVPRKFNQWADRIIMPLPHTGEEFLPAALSGARKRCVIHFYGFGSTRDEKTKKSLDPFEPVVEKIMSACRTKGKKCKILFKRVVRPYAPHVVQIVVDFAVS